MSNNFPALLTYKFSFEGIDFSVLLDAEEQVISQTLIKDFVWEPYQLSVYKYIIAEGDYFIDVGANVGINSIFVKKRINNIHVVAIEPSLINFKILEKNVSGACVSIEMHRLAIADSNGVIHFFGSGTQSKISLTDPKADVVDCKTLDSFMDGLNLINPADKVTLKIDVEGFTDLVLAESYKTLTYLKNLIVEFSYGDVEHRLNTDNQSEIYLHFASLYDKIITYLPCAYFMSRKNGLVAINSIGQLLQCMRYFYGVGDILFTKHSYASINFEIFLSEKILDLMYENHLRINDINELKKNSRSTFRNYLERFFNLFINQQ